MKKVVIIAGKAASGKDTLKRNLVSLFEKENILVNDIITCTTRPMREYEVNGQDYNFYTNQEMTEKLLNGELAEAVIFNDWVYGTEHEAIKEGYVNLGVFNLAGTEALQEDSTLETMVIYLDVAPDIRLIRYLQRDAMDDEKIQEMFRRYKADEEDFLDVEDIADWIIKPKPTAHPKEVAGEVFHLIKKEFDIC